MIIKSIFMSIVAFLAGSIMFSYLIPKYFMGIDIIKDSTDNNPGGANSFKLCGATIGILCVLLDFLKAFIPVFISIKLLNITDSFLIPIALAPILGHAFSPFLSFKGGKAIASTFGVFCGLIPISYIIGMFIIIMIFFNLIITISPHSTMMMIVVCIFDIYVVFSNENITIKIIGLLISLILIYTHKINKNRELFSIKLLRKYNII